MFQAEIGYTQDERTVHHLERACGIPHRPASCRRDGARVVVDPVSLPFMQGSEIDFVDDLIGAQFKVNNPNVTASCGCGTSFSI